jgi:hypothetical protein
VGLVALLKFADHQLKALRVGVELFEKGWTGLPLYIHPVVFDDCRLEPFALGENGQSFLAVDCQFEKVALKVLAAELLGSLEVLLAVGLDLLAVEAQDVQLKLVELQLMGNLAAFHRGEVVGDEVGLLLYVSVVQIEDALCVLILELGHFPEAGAQPEEHDAAEGQRVQAVSVAALYYIRD